MLEKLIESLLPEIVSILEIIGVFVIFIGAIKAFRQYVKHYFQINGIRYELNWQMLLHWGWNLKWVLKYERPC